MISEELLKRKTHLVTALLVISFLVIPIVSLQSSQSIRFHGIVDYSPFLGKGVNYLSLYHVYSRNHTTDDILHRDFSRFQQDGINVVSVSLYWYRLEGNTRGDYDGKYKPCPEEIGGPYGERFLDDVKRVIAIANEHDIKVLVTFHTLWSEADSAWCTPNYVVDPFTDRNMGLAIVRSEDMKQAFIDMFTHTVQYLTEAPGIWAWGILNEPWYWGVGHQHDFLTENGKTQRENFISLMEELSKAVKTLDGRPVTVRFCNTHTWIGTDGLPRIKNIFIDDWGWDKRIFDALDFISFNAGIPEYPELCDTWRNMAAENVAGSVQRSKRVWVTEFGFNSDDDAVQASSYREIVEFYKTLSIDGWVAWFWRSDAAPPGWDENPGEMGMGMNLCGSAKGIPRPAYSEML